MRLRPAIPQDIPFFLAQEARDDYRGFIQRWPAERHAQALLHPNHAYHIALDDQDQAVGYAIHANCLSPHRALYLQRLVISTPGQGLGRPFLTRLLDMAFREWGTHRYWLHVFPGNHRAHHLYRSLGFVEEGVERESLLHDGVYLSPLVLSILAPEWINRQGV